ncbi:MAG TPA: cytochrome C oxidase subunit II [Burkholderiaceae bacterium]|nr:cytochrome C oxidase subunit II [Burkholderiaceae bacterium]
MAETVNASSSDAVDFSERRWALVVAGVVALVFAVIIFASVHWAAQPPSNVETIDASSLHLSGEFMEANLGTAVQPDGSAVVRVIAQQYSFVPSCIVVPTDTPVVFRMTSPDVIHGLLIAGTNINSMVVPGFVAEVRTRFDKPGEHLMPCHEYCSVGHEGMWARVKVVDRREFARDYGGQQRASCVR